jgi:hypothetical protein
MTNKTIATALTLGFLAFTLTTLPVTTAEAGCAWYTGDSCPKDLIESARPPTKGDHYVYCCAKPSQVKADCEARGGNWHYDLDRGACVKTISKAKPEQTEEQSSSEHSSDDSYDDHHHKKKKKGKKTKHSESGDGGFVTCFPEDLKKGVCGR